MKVQLEIAGKSEELDVEFDRLTLSESVKLQRIVGNDAWDQFAAGRIRPDVLQALLYVKLVKTHPDLTLEDVDGDWSAVSEEDEENPTERA